MHVLLSISAPQLESTNNRDRATKFLCRFAARPRVFINNICIVFFYILLTLVRTAMSKVMMNGNGWRMRERGTLSTAGIIVVTLSLSQ